MGNVWTGTYLFVINNIYHIVWHSQLCCSMHEKDFTFWHFVIGRSRWSNMESLCVELCTISIATCGRPSGSIIGHSLSRFVMHIIRCNNYVGLWPLFQKITYGLSYTTTCEGFDKKLGVSKMHQIYLFCYFVLGLNTRTLTYFWLGQWMIKIKL